MFSGRFTSAIVVTAALVQASALAQEPRQTSNPQEPAQTKAKSTRKALADSTNGNDKADAARTQDSGFIDEVRQRAKDDLC